MSDLNAAFGYLIDQLDAHEKPDIASIVVHLRNLAQGS